MIKELEDVILTSDLEAAFEQFRFNIHAPSL